MKLRRRVDHLREGLRIRDALGGEDFLVPVDDPGIEVQRQAHDPAIGFDGVLEAALGEVGEVEIGRRHRLVVDERPQIGEPIVLRELALLHVIRQRDHVEAGVAGIELDDRFLALLLLGNHFGADLDAGHVLEFLVILGEQVSAWALDEQDFDLLSLEALPVEGRLRIGAEQAGAGQRAERGGARSRLQQTAAQCVESIIVCTGCHGVSSSVVPAGPRAA